MEWLKEILGDGLTEENLNKIKKEIPKHYALKSDFNERGNTIKETQAKLDTANASLKDITAKAELSDTLKADLAKITGEFDTFKTEASKKEANTVKRNGVLALLKKNFNPDAVELLAATINLDEITTNEAGEVVDGQIKMDRIAEQRPSLKLTTNVEGTPPGDKPDVNKPDPTKETDEEYYSRLAKEKKG